MRWILLLLLLLVPCMVAATYTDDMIKLTFPGECCMELDLVCEDTPCEEPKDCFQEPCVKIVDDTRYVCRVESYQEFTDMILNSEEYQNFSSQYDVNIMRTNLHYATPYCDIVWTIGFNLTTSLITYEHGFIHTFRWYQGEWTMPRIEYQRWVSYLEAAESNERVRHWVDKYDLDIAHSSDLFFSYQFNNNRYRLEFGIREGKEIVNYQAPLDNLPEFEEVQLALQDPQFAQIVADADEGGFLKLYPVADGWSGQAYNYRSMDRYDIVLNMTSNDVIIAEVERWEPPSRTGQLVIVLLISSAVLVSLVLIRSKTSPGKSFLVTLLPTIALAAFFFPVGSIQLAFFMFLVGLIPAIILNVLQKRKYITFAAMGLIYIAAILLVDYYFYPRITSNLLIPLAYIIALYLLTLGCYLLAKRG